MAHTYEELKAMTVAQMREVAAETEHDALKGYTQLRKDELLHALCLAFGLDEHVLRHGQCCACGDGAAYSGQSPGEVFLEAGDPHTICSLATGAVLRRPDRLRCRDRTIREML